MSAAPPNSSASLPKLTIDGLKDDTTVGDLIKYAKCVENVMRNALEKTDLMHYFEEVQRKIDAIIKNDLLQCPDLKNNKEKFKFV